jgi:hypothetical protein
MSSMGHSVVVCSGAAAARSSAHEGARALGAARVVGAEQRAMCSLLDEPQQQLDNNARNHLDPMALVATTNCDANSASVALSDQAVAQALDAHPGTQVCRERAAARLVQQPGGSQTPCTRRPGCTVGGCA